MDIKIFILLIFSGPRITIGCVHALHCALHFTLYFKALKYLISTEKYHKVLDFGRKHIEGYQVGCALQV